MKLFGPEMLADPYPTYHRLRTSGPVTWIPPLDAWVVTSYDAVSAALRNPNLSSDRSNRIRTRLIGRDPEAQINAHFRSVIHRDPPDHTRIRSQVNKAFASCAADAMEEGIQGLIDGCLQGARENGGMEVMNDLAYPPPVGVIAELRGIPRKDWGDLRKWSDEIAVVLSGDAGSRSDDELRQAMTARNELVDYFRSSVAQDLDGSRQNLLSALARADENGGRLSEEELYSTAVFLLIAGNETTTNLIGNGLLALLRHPEEFRKLKADPTLIPSAVEEMLRFDSPAQMTTRMAKVDIEIGDTAIRQGQWIYLIMAAANRDPARFPDPDRFDVSRPDHKHLAFGAGPHFCPGASLARLEGRLALRTLIDRFPDMRLGSETVEYRNNFNLRGLKTLPVVFRSGT